MLTAEQMYDAVARRDASLAGTFFLGVTTTGIFCRPGCPARIPNEDHCEFFTTAAAAMQAGYRPCRRCSPLSPASSAPPWAVSLMNSLTDDPARVLTAADARRAGVHPATASRFFKRHFGDTFQALSRARRVGLALASIREGRPALRAASDAGFESDSGFRKAVADLFGTTPADAAERGLSPLQARWIITPLGPMLAVTSDAGVCLLEFVDRRMLATNLRTLRQRLARPIVPGTSDIHRRLERELDEYHRAARRDFQTPIHAPGTPFQQRVWDELRRIPCGTTRTYSEIARAIKNPAAVRAVARANGDNRISILIPCHRVIGADGSLTGYGGGLHRKRRLLELESSELGRPLFGNA